MPDTSREIASSLGMKIEQIVDEGKTEKGKLVGIPGHWEDGAALMWETEMKRIGLEPYQGDAEWNKLVDSKGNRLFGTQKSMFGGIWLRWKKPTQSKIDDSLTSDYLLAMLEQNVSLPERNSIHVWNHSATADLFFDGLIDKNTPRLPPGLVSFTSSVILAISVLEELASSSDNATDRSIFSKTAKAYSDLLSFVSLIPGESTAEVVNSALANTEKLLRQGAAVAGAVTRLPTAPVFGGREEDFLRLIENLVSRLKALQDGEFVLVPCGWLRRGGDDHMMVPALPSTRPQQTQFKFMMIFKIYFGSEQAARIQSGQMRAVAARRPPAGAAPPHHHPRAPERAPFRKGRGGRPFSGPGRRGASVGMGPLIRQRPPMGLGDSDPWR